MVSKKCDNYEEHGWYINKINPTPCPYCRIKELEERGLSCVVACPRCEAILDVKLMKAAPEGDVGALVALSSEGER